MKLKELKLLKPFIKDTVYDDDMKYVTLHVYKDNKMVETKEIKIATAVLYDKDFDFVEYFMSCFEKLAEAEATMKKINSPPDPVTVG